MRTAEVEPSLYAADFSRLGEQIEVLLRAGVRIFHFDVGDGHFVEPVTIGPIVLQWISPIIHAEGAFVDCHLMTETPEKHFAGDQARRRRQCHRSLRGLSRPDDTVLSARALDLQIGLAFKPETSAAYAAHAALSSGVDIVLVMSIEPGYSGQEFMPEALDRIRTVRSVLPPEVHVQVDGGIGPENIKSVRDAGASLFVAGSSIFSREDLPRAYRRLVQELARVGVSLERALELAERGRGTTYPNPVVGAVARSRRRDGRRRLARTQGRAARGGGRTRGGRRAGARRDALRDDGALRASRLDAAVHGGRARRGSGEGRRGLARSESGGAAAASRFCVRQASRWSSRTRLRRAHQNEAWRTWVAAHRPFVILKLALTLDGRVAIPGTRWITGEESRRRVHELRAQVDAVAVGMGTVRADDPQLTARDVDVGRQPRRLAFGRGRCRGVGARAANRRARRRARSSRRRRECSRCCSKAGRRWPSRSCAPISSTSLLSRRAADRRQRAAVRARADVSRRAAAFYGGASR